MKRPLRTRMLGELNWLEFASIVPEKTDAVILPVGTIEAHGVISLGTDNLIPEAIARRIAEPVNALIAPTIPYGVTRSLLPYPGSVTVTPETYDRYLFDVCCGLADAGFKRIVIINGHGGNTEALKNLSPRLYREKKVFNLAIDWWLLCADEVKRLYGHAGGHAGTDETALVMADHPEQIYAKKFRKEMAFCNRPGLVATPFPGSIILYEPDQGYPDFDPKRAQRLMAAVSAKIQRTILDVFQRWQEIR